MGGEIAAMTWVSGGSGRAARAGRAASRPSPSPPSAIRVSRRSWLTRRDRELVGRALEPFENGVKCFAMLPPGIVEVEMRVSGQLECGETLTPIAHCERLRRGQDVPAEVHTLAFPELQPLGLRPQRVADAVRRDRTPVGHVVAGGFVRQIANDAAKRAVARDLLHQRGRKAAGGEY